MGSLQLSLAKSLCTELVCNSKMSEVEPTYLPLIVLFWTSNHMSLIHKPSTRCNNRQHVGSQRGNVSRTFWYQDTPPYNIPKYMQACISIVNCWIYEGWIYGSRINQWKWRDPCIWSDPVFFYFLLLFLDHHTCGGPKSRFLSHHTTSGQSMIHL